MDFQHRFVGAPPEGRLDGTLPADQSTIVDAIGRFPGGASYLVTSDAPNLGKGIVSGPDFTCLAQLYPVRDNLTTADLFWFQEADTPAGCPEGGVTARSLPDGATNWILRQGTGEAVFLNAAGQVEPINDGGCYEYLADRYFVLDWIHPDQIQALPTAGSGACGSGGGGGGDGFRLHPHQQDFDNRMRGPRRPLPINRRQRLDQQRRMGNQL